MDKDKIIPPLSKTSVSQSVIKPKDLRIGNLLHFNFTAENVEIIGINAHSYGSETTHTFSFETDKNLYCEKLSLLSAIDISDGWLKRLGFITTDNLFYNLDDFKIITHKGHNFKWTVIFKDVLIRYNIEYVHKLQNLYFSLTGRELTVD